jgi:RNA recognition motif-containing protein
MVRTKVFVGNLDFRTKEADLAKAFAVGGKVISANIITRGPRSLGYGFVEFDNEADADNAVKLMNKQEVDGRAINVELAKPRQEVQEGQQQQTGEQQQNNNQQAFRGRGRGGFRGGRGGRGRGGFRGGYRGRGGYGRRGRGGRGRGRGGRTYQERGQNKQQQQNNNQQNQQQEPDNRTPSKTLLFVANLPWKLDDEGFTKTIKDAGLNVKKAYVVRNQRSGRSKGFGFAEFENEADQQKALGSLAKLQVEGRDLIVKVALTENPQPSQAKAEENKQPAQPAQKQ